MTEKRQHVVFTEASELDVLNDHHIVVVYVEHSVVDQRHWIDSVALQQFCIGVCHPPRGVD